MAAVAALALGSFAANSIAADNVAPTKAELEDMYNAAYRAFDSNKYSEALKQLDAIDARQPDLAASKNLRGVILMRQSSYDDAEKALQEASRIDPKFWNARFNLAEIPFLKKDWAEARRRFEKLLSSGESDLAKEASQLIQYKILLTYLMEGKTNMVDSILAKLELSPDTPAVDYVKAAVALQQKNQREAQDWISAAEKNFTPQLNKLFAESLYEVGWLEKPSGQGRPSLPLMTAAERTEKTKAAARSKFDQAQQAFRQRDFVAALALVNEADQADPNQPATINLRGEILMQQQKFDDAEAAFKKAAKLDPKFREAQYNLAQVPFKRKDYAKARERFEALYKRTPGGDRNQAAELLKFKIYMTLLLEGKESRAHAMMDEFQFTGDTPALYYAQAAWEYKHNNGEKAEDWTKSANNIYSPALNSVFADAFYDAGWIQRPEGSAAPAVAFDTTSTASQAEGGPAVEPSPIPDRVFAANKQAAAPSGNTLSLAPATTSAPNSGMELASAAATTTNQPATSVASEPSTETSSQPQPAPSESPAPVIDQATTAPQPVASEAPNIASASSDQSTQQPATQPSPSGKSAVATAAGIVSSLLAGERRMWVVGGLLAAALVILAWVLVPVLRRHAFTPPRHLRLEPPRSDAAATPAVLAPRVAQPRKDLVQGGNGFTGGPRQVSLQLHGWKSSLRHAALPSGKAGGALDRLKAVRAKAARTPIYHEPDREVDTLDAEPAFESSVGQVVEQAPETVASVTSQAPDVAAVSEPNEAPEFSRGAWEESTESLERAEEVTLAEQDRFGDGDANESSATARQTASFAPEPSEATSETDFAWPAVEPAAELTVEPSRGEEVYELVSSANQSPVEETPAIFPEPVFPQITTPATMTETSQTPAAPITKAPAPPVPKPQPQSQPQAQPAPVGMQTSVQLTFSFEIAAMQLTPSFKMGVLKVRPTSKLVTMRLPSPQRAQSALNLQVAFEVVKIQPVAGALGTIRVVPSQQQRPAMGGLPSFAVAGLQVVPNSETAPVQLTPSQQGRASVFITVPFQISTLEFSPSLEIASVILNSNSKQVVVQLPGAGPGQTEGAPMFEIANLELNEGGEIAMMQLNLLGGTKRA
jgi:Flp pilus assembly protein TadD